MKHYQRNSAVEAVSMDGELVMMGQEQDEYYGLRNVAAALWQHLAESRTLDELCQLVAAEYAVTSAECRTDIVAFLDQLESRKLLQVVG